METIDKLKALVGIKNAEQIANEKQEAFQEKQLELQSRRSPVEAAQSMALMKNAGSDGQYELGALALDPDPDIEEIKSFLRGYRIVQVEDRGVIKNVPLKMGEPAMSDDGINYVVQNLRVYSGKSFVLTSYSGGKDNPSAGFAMIMLRCELNGYEFVKTIAMKEKEWKIDMSKMPMATELYTNYVESCLLRSLDSKTAAHYWGSQKSIQHTTQQISDAPVKKSMFANN